MVAFKREWCKPSTILFATECPASERNFTVALAHAKESGAKLIVFHVAPTRTPIQYARTNGVHYGAVFDANQLLDPLAQHAWDLGIDCQVAVREGNAAEEILKYTTESHVDRVVMGAHTAGPVGKLLVGSVAETLLRTAGIPVTIVGPYLVDHNYRNFLTRIILCVVSGHRSSRVVARFAAELAMQHGARSILQHVIPPQRKAELMTGQTTSQMERQLLGMIPAHLLAKACVRARVSIGDPAEELLYQGRALRANVIVIGAHDVTHFAAVSNAGYIYKIMAHATCPVIVMPPVILARGVPETELPCPSDDNFIAGVI